mgnify:CR=1 FL=1
MEKLVLIAFLLLGYNSAIDFEEGDSTVYKEITAQDSTKHWFIDIRDGDNWCWKHNTWEDVRIVNPTRMRRKEQLSLNH